MAQHLLTLITIHIRAQFWKYFKQQFSSISTIEESLNNATHLTTNNFGYQKEQQAKIKLYKLKKDVSSLIPKVQESNKNAYKAYEEIEFIKTYPQRPK
ncbi:Immunogenic protein p35 (plasmid) [Borrelia nietonii YOR]|uniref:Immunogenic protein p35 n=1 Tax=Borrelia nietonii YOR TaxID=1293576 RepID=W5SC83_9SPIR|nr:hypothetical protein [Borrelia nietonii]AHH04520.1 Immunogenic protein p35 [Borrelia nietonii YOR]UPA09932.1 hypothetical protein bhYOR_001238 [Borrelia nietonii YOR]UPA09979.1 hypothetical protein bhYOR_001301 [Borrelia nietonii YOR]